MVYRKTMADNMKEEGNAKLKAGDLTGAVDAYTRALALDPEHKLPSAAALLGNRSLAHLKLKNYKACVDDCTAALLVDPRYGKAYYRRAQAREALEELSSAFTDLRELLRIEPDNKEAIACAAARSQTRVQAATRCRTRCGARPMLAHTQCLRTPTRSTTRGSCGEDQADGADARVPR